MKSLVQYILEAHFNNTEYSKIRGANGETYLQLVIKKLLDDDEGLALGNTSAEKYIKHTDLSKDDIESLTKLLTDKSIKDPVAEFNNIVKKYGFKFNMVYKAPFSKYVNKGIDFESIYINEFETTYKSGLEDALNIHIDTSDIKHDGTKNTKRSLQIKNDMVVCLPKDCTNFDFGKYISDITVVDKNLGNIYLSLKEGPTVTFVNTGVNNPNIFSHNEMTKRKNDTNYNVKFGSIGQSILNLFDIDPNVFTDIFIAFDNKEDKKRKMNYSKDIQNITDKVDKKHLFSLIYSCIGYGYILVHKINNDIHYYDLRKESDMKKLVGNNIKDCYVVYPKDGATKRLNIFVELDNLSLKINIRSKNGGIYPTHLMCDYKFKH